MPSGACRNENRCHGQLGDSGTRMASRDVEGRRLGPEP